MSAIGHPDDAAAGPAGLPPNSIGGACGGVDMASFPTDNRVPRSRAANQGARL